jgi:hypothetical protein
MVRANCVVIQVEHLRNQVVLGMYVQGWQDIHKETSMLLNSLVTIDT